QPMNSENESPLMATHCSRRSFLLAVARSAQSAVPFFAVARPPLFPNAHKPDQADRANQRFEVADGVLSEASLIQHETHRTFSGPVRQRQSALRQLKHWPGARRLFVQRLGMGQRRAVDRL